MQRRPNHLRGDAAVDRGQERLLPVSALTTKGFGVLVWVSVLGIGLSLARPVHAQTSPNDPTSYQEIKPDRGDASPTSPMSNRLTQHLWQSRITPPDPNEDIETRQSIDELIRKIRSVKFDDATPEPTFTPPSTNPVPQSEPNRPAQAVQTEEESPAPVVAAPRATTAPITPLSEATLKKLEGLLEDPNQVSNPLEVAELLFLSGRPIQAGTFYQRALTLMPADPTGTNTDRAWTLFQLGNCLRETNIAKAKEMYMRLIADYPASPWTELAKAHGRLITWYQSTNPKQFVSQEESP